MKPVLECAESKITQMGMNNSGPGGSSSSGQPAPSRPGGALEQESHAEHERRKAVRAAEQAAQQAKAQAGRQTAMIAAQAGMPQPAGVSNGAWRQAVFSASSRGGPYNGGKGKGKKDSNKGGKGDKGGMSWSHSGAWGRN